MTDERNPLDVLAACIATGDEANYDEQEIEHSLRDMAADGRAGKAPAPARPGYVDPERLLADDEAGAAPNATPGSQLAYGGEVIELPPQLAGDAAAADRFTSWARGEGLSPRQVRSLIAFEAGRQRAAGGGVEQQEAAWRRESLATFQPDEIREARGLLRRFGTPELQRFLDESGLGSRREVIQLMINISRHDRPGR
jgi:hypothetical protein